MKIAVAMWACVIAAHCHLQGKRFLSGCDLPGKPGLNLFVGIKVIGGPFFALLCVTFSEPRLDFSELWTARIQRTVPEDLVLFAKLNPLTANH